MISGEISANNKGNGVLWKGALNVVGKTTRTITSTDFPEPALSAYSAENPFVLQDTTLDMNGALTNFESLAFSFTNRIPTAQYFESGVIQRLPWCGRDIGLRMRLLYKTEAHRADFISQAAKDVVVTINNGTKAITLDMNANNRINGLGRNLNLDDSFYLDMTLVGTLDATAGIDMGYSVV